MLKRRQLKLPAFWIVSGANTHCTMACGHRNETNKLQCAVYQNPVLVGARASDHVIDDHVKVSSR